jgi:hypothetical protein
MVSVNGDVMVSVIGDVMVSVIGDVMVSVIDVVMVSVLVSSAVVHGFEPRSCQIKLKLVFVTFPLSTQH